MQVDQEMYLKSWIDKAPYRDMLPPTLLTRPQAEFLSKLASFCKKSKLFASGNRTDPLNQLIDRTLLIPEGGEL